MSYSFSPLYLSSVFISYNLMPSTSCYLFQLIPGGNQKLTLFSTIVFNATERGNQMPVHYNPSDETSDMHRSSIPREIEREIERVGEGETPRETIIDIDRLLREPNLVYSYEPLLNRHSDHSATSSHHYFCSCLQQGTSRSTTILTLRRIQAEEADSAPCIRYVNVPVAFPVPVSRSPLLSPLLDMEEVVIGRFELTMASFERESSADSSSSYSVDIDNNDNDDNDDNASSRQSSISFAPEPISRVSTSSKDHGSNTPLRRPGNPYARLT
ncbi:hypothetical protein BDV06DRAFT_224846 [Aspergillus oleicola]